MLRLFLFTMWSNSCSEYQQINIKVVKYCTYANKSSERKPIQMLPVQQRSHLCNKKWHVIHSLELPTAFLHYSESHNIQLLLQMQLQKVTPNSFTCLYPLRICYKLANLKHVLNLIKELSFHPGNFGKIKSLVSSMIWLLLLSSCIETFNGGS